MGVESAWVALASKNVRKKLGLQKSGGSDENASAAKADASTSTTDSAATGSSVIYDGMLSEDAIAKLKKKKVSTGTMVDEGSQTFGGGVLGS